MCPPWPRSGACSTTNTWSGYTCTFGTAARSTQSRTAFGWKPKTSVSTGTASGSSAGRSTHRTPASSFSRRGNSSTGGRVTPSAVIHRISTRPLALRRSRRVLGEDPLRRPARPRLAHELGQRGRLEFVEADQDGGVAVEVVRREVDVGLGRDQRPLGALVRHARGQHRPGRRVGAELLEVLAPQRALPRERLVLHP